MLTFVKAHVVSVWDLALPKCPCSTVDDQANQPASQPVQFINRYPSSVSMPPTGVFGGYSSFLHPVPTFGGTHLPSYCTLPHPALLYPSLFHAIPPYCTLAYHIPPYPTLSYPTLHYPILFYPIIHYPALPYPTLPYYTLPYLWSSRVNLVMFHFVQNIMLKNAFRCAK